MKLLLTGATGFLGGAVLAELLARGRAAEVLLLVRGHSAAEGLARVVDMLELFEVPAAQSSALTADQVLIGDLSDVAAFSADPRLDGVTHVVNCAAIATFSNNPQIWPINVEGTFEFARRMAAVPGLQRFLHVGTAMACGPSRQSPIAESWEIPPPEEHLVPYTASKGEIEARLRRELPQLPLVVARPSIVVGHTRLGCRPSGSIFWVFRMALALEAFTCSLDERIDVVPVDYCAGALTDLALKEHLQHDLYHIAAGMTASCSFAEIDAVFAGALGAEPIGERYRIVGQDDLPELAGRFEERIGQCNRRLMVRAMRLYGGFAELNYVFDNSRLLAEGIPPPPRLTDYLPVCVATSQDIPIPEQMHWDFK